MKDLRFTPLRFTLLLASCLTLSGCGPTGVSYPTPIPPDVLPTAIAQTAEALNATAFALTPSATSTPTALPPTRTRIPTSTYTPTPIPPAPTALIQIEAPGPMSLLATPLQLRLFVIPGQTDVVQVALFGELTGAAPIWRDLIPTHDVPPPGVNLSMEIRFEIRAAQLGRLEVSTRDRAGRIETLTSMHLTLLPMGLSQVNPPDPPFERAAIYSPESGASVSGGTLAVEGAFWPVNDQPVILELQDESGRELMTRQLPPMVGNTYLPFSITIPYKVSEPIQARLSIRQADPRFNAIAYLYSVVVTLNP